jgi:hypothetical protein
LDPAVGDFIAPAVNVQNIQHFITVLRQKIDRVLKTRLGLVKRPEPQFAPDEMSLSRIIFATADDCRIKPFNVRLEKIQCFYPVQFKQLRNGLAFHFSTIQRPALIFHPLHFNNAVERFERRTCSSEIVAAKNVLSRHPLMGFWMPILL